MKGMRLKGGEEKEKEGGGGGGGVEVLHFCKLWRIVLHYWWSIVEIIK